MRKNDLERIESQIVALAVTQAKSRFLIGQLLIKVNEQQLYNKSDKYKSFTSWLKSFSNQVDITESTLGMYKRVVLMLNELNIPHENIKAPITGLDKITSIYAIDNDRSKACLNIEHLSDKKIRISKLNSELKTVRYKINKQQKDKIQPNSHFYGMFYKLATWNLGYAILGICTVFPIY